MSSWCSLVHKWSLKIMSLRNAFVLAEQAASLVQIVLWSCRLEEEDTGRHMNMLTLCIKVPCTWINVIINLTLKYVYVQKLIKNSHRKKDFFVFFSKCDGCAIIIVLRKVTWLLVSVITVVMWGLQASYDWPFNFSFMFGNFMISV